MLRLIGGTIAGVVAWSIVVTLLNLALRHGWPDYAAVERAMAFTLSMMLARLAESGASSLLSGWIAARVSRWSRAGLVSGVILLLVFLPLHYGLWQRFPIWYHLVFLASLPLFGCLGGRLAYRTQASSPARRTTPT